MGESGSGRCEWWDQYLCFRDESTGLVRRHDGSIPIGPPVGSNHCRVVVDSSLPVGWPGSGSVKPSDFFTLFSGGVGTPRGRYDRKPVAATTLPADGYSVSADEKVSGRSDLARLLLNISARGWSEKYKDG